MSVSTVSTYALFQSTLGDVSQVESSLNTEDEQLSSGNAFQNFAEMGSQTQNYLSLDNVLAKTSQYLSSNQVVETQVNAASSALTQIISTATSLQSLISQQTSNTGSPNDTAAFATQLQGVWKQLASQLNTQVSGQYVFGGTADNTTPVDASTFPSLEVTGTPDASYYKGSDQDMTARAQDNTLITYNVRADSPGFQQIIAGLVMAQKSTTVITGQTPGEDPTTDLQKAANLIQSGLEGVIGIQATVGAIAGQFSTIDTNLTNQKLYWQGLQQTIGSTDVVSVSTQVAINQGILQAAFEAFSKITSLNLAQYLK